MNLRNILIGGAAALALTACSSKKDTVLPYFTDISTVAEGTMPAGDYMPEIKPDDELYITVNSLTPEATSIYNLPAANPATSSDITSSVNPRQQTYVVDTKGDINFPILGTIHVAGMTTDQLQELLTREISKDVENPHVRVQLMNFKVVVAGEVNNPSTVNVNRNRFSILDALSAAGDLTPYGERSNILLIREENGERKFVHLDLNSSELLNSPYFYLQQNDYVYVEPNKVRQSNAKYNQDNAYKLQVTSTVVSAASVIASLVIALTVK
ncbi:MAG: polysaccharide biosynthesis/export family protein [Muribaculaceae bacterium]|nr:polysaccharide biosynthesis/export family protein [Muribaculaceae bacterium]